MLAVMVASDVSKEIVGKWIQGMEECDLDEVLLIEAASRQTSWSRQSFIEEMKNPLSSCFVLKQRNGTHDQALGFICFRLIGEESELLNLAIHPLYRHRGLGKELMTFYVNFCYERKVKSFFLETGASNQPAIRLYGSFGYRIEGVRPRFYRGEEDALLMVKKAPSSGEP